MLITKFDQTPLKDLSFNELVRCLTQHAFFLFMDRGREGLRNAVADAIDTTMEWQDQVYVARSGSVLKQRQKMEPKAILDLHTEGEQLAIDGFVMKGSEGLQDGLRRLYIVVLNSRSTR